MVTKGYKLTEVGEIPEDWEVKTLEDICQGIFRGASPRPIASPVWFDENSKIGWVRISDISSVHKTLSHTEQHLSTKGIQKSRFIQHPALIMSICATIGKPIITMLDVCIHDGFVEFNNPNINKIFLYYILEYLEPSWQKKGQTGSQMNLNTNIIKNTLIALPKTSSEQAAIAEALSDMDALIDALEQSLAKKRLVKQGAMQELLTGKRRLPGFTGGWYPKPIKTLANISSGGTPNTSIEKYWHGDIVWIVPTDITESHKKYISSSKRKITEKGMKNSAATLLPPGTLLLCTRATIGELAIAATPVSTNQGFKNLSCFDNVDNEWLYYAIQPMKETIIAQASGSTFLEISKTTLENIEILTPADKSEQTAIAAVLADMDEEIAALENRLAKTRLLKSGMMQQLLTGKIRLL
ncbi:MAG: restriction endonuclease subunit S [Alistipes senegalensis]|nr:restriction endonuclease subunit S [Oxalobacter formigenes]MCM1281547.1 restriction endonuclease subunit S [Alistipes senegalensis]